MPFIKRHRAGDQMPTVVHPDPDPRAILLCERLITHAVVQAVILGGSRCTGGWDEQSDLDVVVILEESGDPEEMEKTAALALADLKGTYYPGYEDWQNPDHAVEHGEWIVPVDYFLTNRRTVNHPMAQASQKGSIFTKKPEDTGRYRHDGDTSNEWELVTLPKLRRARIEYDKIPMVKRFFDDLTPSRLNVRSEQGRTAYWLIWSSGSAIISTLGITYRNRSLVNMAETLQERDPGWSHQFASDLDCLDQYNGCGCEVVVTRSIDDLGAMWEALETDRKALWQRILELSGYDLSVPVAPSPSTR